MRNYTKAPHTKTRQNQNVSFRNRFRNQNKKKNNKNLPLFFTLIQLSTSDVSIQPAKQHPALYTITYKSRLYTVKAAEKSTFLSTTASQRQYKQKQQQQLILKYPLYALSCASSSSVLWLNSAMRYLLESKL